MSIGTGHRLILVREQDAQHSGSGCCGRLGEAHTDLGGAADYAHSRAVMESVGMVYRRLRDAAPGLVIDVVDPRNTIWLYPAVWRASRRAGRGVGASLKSLSRAGAAAAIVLDGEVLYSGALPAPETIVAAVMAQLHDSRAA
ncbi:hypothetical protein [Salinisphaera sp. LB1]|uniref:hypothetical protein n=1 Tax=Salinisphaera sp. LB1 TaxID=2183911 RepID=UPI000D708DD0|nr:hypothetical protein [Salinisphaera sp. LB1]AWN16396.1 hypothetical protein SALB1_2198 [Salinisphaera sp. LB1]